MSDDSPQLLWRGSDPAKFTALQAALRDEGIEFRHAQVYDPAGGFLISRPFYSEATPGYEIRVRPADMDLARSALKWVESKATTGGGASAIPTVDAGPVGPELFLPDDWDPQEATSEAWSETGEDAALGEYLASALRENGIPSHFPDEPGNRLRLCVRPADLARAREIVREIVDGVPPKE